MAPPLISIGMPVYNCAGTIAQAITSILNQTFTDWELLVIDDGSRDRSCEIAASFGDPRIVVKRGTENRRLPERLNECVGMARGMYFARMDADDIAYPRRLQTELDYLRSHQDVDLVGGWVVVFRGDGIPLGTRRSPLKHDAICARPWSGISMAHPTWMGRAEWFIKNPYRLDAMGMEDQELLFRTHEHSRFANLPEVLLGYRENSLSLSKSLRARRGMCRMMIRVCREKHMLATGALGLLGLAAKSLIDTIAIGTGLNYQLLRHRAPAIRQDEAIEWRTVWEQVRLTCAEVPTDSALPLVSPQAVDV